MNISSTEGIVARPDHCAYVTSKAALGGLTRSVAIDYGRKGVRDSGFVNGADYIIDGGRTAGS